MSNEIATISKEEFWTDMKGEYEAQLSVVSDVYPPHNPGPTKEDGTMNFECHCVGHLVASPCGYEFREAISCQKAASEEELQEGACGKELMMFMECAMRTQCFQTNESREEKEEKKD